MHFYSTWKQNQGGQQNGQQKKDKCQHRKLRDCAIPRRQQSLPVSVKRPEKR